MDDDLKETVEEEKAKSKEQDEKKGRTKICRGRKAYKRIEVF